MTSAKKWPGPSPIWEGTTHPARIVRPTFSVSLFSRGPDHEVKRTVSQGASGRNEQDSTVDTHHSSQLRPGSRPSYRRTAHSEPRPWCTRRTPPQRVPQRQTSHDRASQPSLGLAVPARPVHSTPGSLFPSSRPTTSLCQAVADAEGARLLIPTIHSADSRHPDTTHSRHHRPRRHPNGRGPGNNLGHGTSASSG
ncbi:hypothetical protein VTK56DRAFT_4144 [Thermocarpiscus australiensis]